MSAALTRYMPMDGGPPSVTVVPEGFHFPSGKESVAHAGSSVDEHYFDTIGLPILEGRGFRDTDSDDAPRVVVVNGVLAERYWPGQSAIGKRLRLDDGGGGWAEIVGVAKTSKYAFAIEGPMAFVYLPFRQRPPEGMFLLGFGPLTARAVTTLEDPTRGKGSPGPARRRSDRDGDRPAPA